MHTNYTRGPNRLIAFPFQHIYRIKNTNLNRSSILNTPARNKRSFLFISLFITFKYVYPIPITCNFIAVLYTLHFEIHIELQIHLFLATSLKFRYKTSQNF